MKHNFNITGRILLMIAIIAILSIAVYAAEGTVYEIIDAMNAQYDECALGDLTADAVRYTTGADIALVGGGLLKMNLPYGPLTEDVLNDVYTSNAEVRIYKLDADTLYRLFEISVARECQLENGDLDSEGSAFPGFLQISGLKFVWDASGPAGSRVYTLEDATGVVLDREDTEYYAYAAVTSDLLLEAYGYEELLGEPVGEETDLFSCLKTYAEAEQELYSPEIDRIYVRAANRNQLVKNPAFVLLAVAVFFLGSVLAKRVKAGKNDRWS